jgi:hypothetical protein
MTVFGAIIFIDDYPAIGFHRARACIRIACEVSLTISRDTSQTLDETGVGHPPREEPRAVGNLGS